MQVRLFSCFVLVHRCAAAIRWSMWRMAVGIRTNILRVEFAGLVQTTKMMRINPNGCPIR